MDSDSRKIIILAIFVVVVLIILIVSFFMQRSGDEGSEESLKIAPFPDSVQRIDDASSGEEGAYVPFSPAENATTSETSVATNVHDFGQNNAPWETNWQDDVVEYTEPAIAASGGYNSQTSQYTQTNTTALPAGNTVADYNSILSTLLEYAEGQTLGTNALVSPIPSLREELSDKYNCGSVKVPEGESAYEDFFDDLGEMDEVICMGQAVADNCHSAILTVKSDIGINVYVYVAKRADGVCGSDFTPQADYINLCSIEATLNSLTGKKRTFTQWQKVFTEEPGETFASLYTDQSFGTKSDCQVHSF